MLNIFQGHENYQIIYERDLFLSRIKDYKPAYLDRLCYSGEVIWRRFDSKRLKRGQIGFCFRQHQAWVVPDPSLFDMQYHYRWKDDIKAEVSDAIKESVLAEPEPVKKTIVKKKIVKKKV